MKAILERLNSFSEKVKSRCYCLRAVVSQFFFFFFFVFYRILSHFRGFALFRFVSVISFRLGGFVSPFKVLVHAAEIGFISTSVFSTKIKPSWNLLSIEVKIKLNAIDKYFKFYLARMTAGELD